MTANAHPSEVPGTRGYERGFDRFVEASRTLAFETVCSDFIGYLPKQPSQVLDLGAGAGQNSFALARLGHSVVAVEPMPAFLAEARRRYHDLPITWICDSLPHLARLEAYESFQFVLVEAVWHHLDPVERTEALARLCHLLTPDGHLACSLRNGPAGLGTRVFPTNSQEMTQQASDAGLVCELRKDDLPSLLPNKPDVTWSRLVFRKA